MTKNKLINDITSYLRSALFLVVISSQLALLVTISEQNSAFSIGFISHHASHKMPNKRQENFSSSTRRTSLAKRLSKHTKKFKLAVSPPQLHQLLSSNFQTQTLAPGVIYKRERGALRINILDIDTNKAPVLIKPIVPQEGGARLQTVNSYAASSHALAAINANYFKNNGIPLGTLILDGNWLSGPLYDRVALGISNSGFLRMDRVSLGGTLYTSNLDAPKIWINNINQPRRTGSHIIAYTQKWGNFVQLAYDGCLVAIDAQGQVTDCAPKQLTIPYGGMVLSDSKDGALSTLKVGDLTYLHWQMTPGDWQDIQQAISGGPMLLKNGNYCIDLQAENFRPGWANNHIKARTACGITANNHLLLVTVEGSHTLYDLAHVLHALGAIDAMNLDGGGSTTMVIHNATMNIESKSNQRKVAAALGIFLTNNEEKSSSNHFCHYVPRQKLPDLLSVSDKDDINTANSLNNQVNIKKAL